MLLLYTYSLGTVSSRKIERACDEDLAFQVLTGNQQPDQRLPTPRNADAIARKDHKLRSKAGLRVYAQRKAIVEPVNGQIKEARGLSRFLMRGLENVDAAWHLIAATHNLVKFFRHKRSQQQILALASG